MSNGTVEPDGRYWAFISYSHKDAVFGRRLHRRLEAYALPRRLVGRDTASGFAVPRRLVPIFRDREEFPAAQDLSAEVRAALRDSRSLIVVCSPAAAASPWVAREIELFRELHPGRPVLAAIRAGEPQDSLPPVLRLRRATGDLIEPLAADFRRGHDGWELGLLKLVAGLLGVGLDELVQRDSQRRTQRVTAVTAAALALVLVMAVLTVFALNAQAEAERQRIEAEGLVKFMYTDLREELRGVGRLQLMAAVNDRAMLYYNRELGTLSDKSRALRADILKARAEDDLTQGDDRGALIAAREAWQETQALLAAAPNDPSLIFDHAQSEYWLGLYEYYKDRYIAARNHFELYRAMVSQLVARFPDDARYRRELAFAEGDLCSAILHPPKDGMAGLRFCLEALAQMKIAARVRPALRGIDADLSNRESWLGTAYQANGDNPHALEHWLIQERMLNDLMRRDPLNVDRRTEWIALQRNLARLDKAEGRMDSARARLNSSLKLLDDLIRLDPTNKQWALRRTKTLAEIPAVQPDTMKGTSQ